MNRERRKAIAELVVQLRDLLDQLEPLKDAAENLRDEEQEAFDALPEGLQQSERGQVSESAAENLGYVAESLIEADAALNSAITQAEEAAE